jgi:hypothetical protein
MANLDQPKGLWPIRHLCGGEIRTNTYIVSTSAAAIYKGDVVMAEAAGTVKVATATSGVLNVGVAAEWVTAATSATAGATIQVYDDPYIVFGVQCDSGTTAAATDVFATADLVVTTGDTVLGSSKHELDASDLAGASQSSLKVIGLVDDPNNAWGEPAKVEVLLNEHLYKAVVAGV